MIVVDLLIYTHKISKLKILYLEYIILSMTILTVELHNVRLCLLNHTIEFALQ